MTFDDDPDYDLMFFMNLQEGDPVGAKGAFGAFWTRHQPYLLKQGERYQRELGGVDGVGDLVYDTLLMAWKKAGSFHPGQPGTPPEKQSTHVRRWLLTIMKNLYLDTRRAPGPLLQPLEEWHLEVPVHVEANAVTEEARLLREVISELPEREQTILYKTIECFDHAKGKSALSSEELKLLADSLGTTADNIRQIRKRTFATVRTRLNQRLPVRAKTTKQQRGGMA